MVKKLVFKVPQDVIDSGEFASREHVVKKSQKKSAEEIESKVKKQQKADFLKALKFVKKSKSKPKIMRQQEVSFDGAQYERDVFNPDGSDITIAENSPINSQETAQLFNHFTRIILLPINS